MTSDCICDGTGTCTTCHGTTSGCGDCGYTGRCDCGAGYEASWGESGGDIPDTRVKYWHGSYWREQPHPDSPWIDMGIAPVPETSWQTIRYHICHGLIMQYPIISILSFAWRNRHSFEETIDDLETQD